MTKPVQAYLKRLRSGGRTNMYGAIPYLVRAFSLSREDAFKVVCEWEDEAAADAGVDSPTSTGEIPTARSVTKTRSRNSTARVASAPARPKGTGQERVENRDSRRAKPRKRKAK